MAINTPQKILSFLAGTALCAASTLSAATTDPVGYVTLTVKGTGGSGSSAFSFLSAPLHSAVESSSAISSFGASTISSSNVNWTNEQFANTHFVQITSGTNAGASASITSNTADTLTTADDISSLLTVGDTFAIRKYTTLADIFGSENEVGLQGGSGPGSADNILIPREEGGFDFYYYKSAGLIGGTGWRSSASPSIDESGKIIPFGSSFIVSRIAVSDLSLTVSGSVITNDSILPVFSGINWSGPVAPISYTIAELFGANNEASLVGGSSAGNADNILIPKEEGGFEFYYYKNSGLIGGTGWRSSSSPSVDEAGRILAQPGGSFIIDRSQGSDFNLIELNPVAAQ